MVLDFLIEYTTKITRVSRFLLTQVLRNRFLKKQKATRRLQNFFRMLLAKNKIKKLKTINKEKDRRRRMEIFCQVHKDKRRLNEAASLIQNKICTKIKKQAEARELRQKLKDLPYVCRSSFVKMHYLKA